ncbi:response regulator [Poseidonibacter sp.]|uniref:response regulator n=2 Tax=Poseidonibacter sp. TaxID=2321188 RepID=UPI003C787BEE
MLNKEFLKTLTILYVENDENIITSFEPFLNNLFKKVFISNNGKDALTKYNDLINNKEQIDIIISESTMPYMSGIELLSKIRESNKNLPFIFFTEDNDINLLLESLKQDVTAHFTKPVKFEEVLQKVEEVCLVKKEEDKVLHSQAEVEEYLEIINKVAVVFIFDENGKINYVNEFLKELVGCEDDDIIGEDYKIIYHHEIAKEILKNQEETLLNGQNWQGKLKYITRNSSTFYANSTIFPILHKNSNEIKKFISVNFITTKEEQNKRDYKKKVLYNLQETRKVYKVAQDKIDILEKELEKYKDYNKVEEAVNDYKKHNQEQYNEILRLQNRLKNGNKKFEQLTYGLNKEINKIATMTSEMKISEVRSSKKIIRVTEEIKTKEAYIQRIKEEIEKRTVKIKNLKDVENHRKEQVLAQKEKQ